MTKIPGDILLTKMLAEWTSTEQIFTETSRLVPLKNVQKEGIFDCRDSFILGD